MFILSYAGNLSFLLYNIKNKLGFFGKYIYYMLFMFTVMVWMRQNKELNIKCRAKNDIFPNSRKMNKRSLCHHSCTLILNVHHFHVGVSCPDHHILPRIADAYNLIHRPNTLCRMRDSHITHNLPRVDATSLDLNIALACIRWHLTGTPLLSR